MIITGGDDTATTRAEHVWLHQHVPGARITLQSLLFERGPPRDKVIDKLDVVLPDGSKKTYYFDISSGFGQLD